MFQRHESVAGSKVRRCWRSRAYCDRHILWCGKNRLDLCSGLPRNVCPFCRRQRLQNNHLKCRVRCPVSTVTGNGLSSRTGLPPLGHAKSRSQLPVQAHLIILVRNLVLVIKQPVNTWFVVHGLVYGLAGSFTVDLKQYLVIQVFHINDGRV